MYIIVGLGNPEEKYLETRHNMGFNTINEISQKYNIEVKEKKHKGLIGKGIIEGEKVILLKPQTYMNLSGNSILECMNFYKINKEKLIVIYDDIDIKLGIIKIRKKGGAGTHNGMKSVITNLQTEEFARVRIGIGSPENKEDLINYVIGQINQEDKEELEQSVNTAEKAVIEIIKSGIDKAMNKYN